MTRRSTDHKTIEAEIDRIRSLGLDELRALWRTTLRSSPPPAFTKDLMTRFFCWHIQEQAHGGVDANIAKLLDGLARGDKPGADRRLKPGTVLVREYQGDRHTVTVVPGGYVWRDATYASLSAIACNIPGTAWNGPRLAQVWRQAQRDLRGTAVGANGVELPEAAEPGVRAGCNAGETMDRA